MSAGLAAVVAEIERHVAEDGWDQPLRLYALVATADLLRREPALAASLGLAEATTAALTPVEQDSLPPGPLDDVLAGVGWPAEVLGCAVVTEATVLPPGADGEAPPEGMDPAGWASRHPDRREVRMAVGVLRDGSRAATLRLRGTLGAGEEVLGGPDLVPNLADALAATLVD
ncbi:MAG: PPA1309 family protein [Mycobacteriales bacterium]